MQFKLDQFMAAEGKTTISTYPVSTAIIPPDMQHDENAPTKLTTFLVVLTPREKVKDMRLCILSCLLCLSCFISIL